MLTKEMMDALEADGEKLRQLSGEDHGPHVGLGWVRTQFPEAFADELCLMCWKRRVSGGWYHIGEGDEGPEYFCSEECFEENRR